MDMLGHMVYGATVCSRAGLGGGREGSPAGGIWRDCTVWAALGFSAFPDVFSIGVAFAQMALRGEPASFHALPPYVFVLYRFTHSLAIACPLVVLLRWTVRRLYLPALAWPLQIFLDSMLHDDGRWQTPMFFPVSDWRPSGINWWQHPGIVLMYWGLLPVIWVFLYGWRRRSGRTRRSAASGNQAPGGA